MNKLLNGFAKAFMVPFYEVGDFLVKSFYGARIRLLDYRINSRQGIEEEAYDTMICLGRDDDGDYLKLHEKIGRLDKKRQNLSTKLETEKHAN